MRAVPWRLSVKESSRRPAEGSFSPASAFAGSTPSRRIGAALPRMNGAPKRSGRISSGPLRPVGLQCGQTRGSVVLLAPERQSAVGWPVGDAPAGLFGRARSHGRPRSDWPRKGAPRRGRLPAAPRHPRRRPHPPARHRCRVRCRRRTRPVAGCAAAPTGADPPRSPPGTPRRIRSSLRPPGLARRRTGIRRRAPKGCVQTASPTAFARTPD